MAKALILREDKKSNGIRANQLPQAVVTFLKKARSLCITT